MELLWDLFAVNKFKLHTFRLRIFLRILGLKYGKTYRILQDLEKKHISLLNYVK